ncbi:unnamed protein product [Protopolystoma xenopodis]|uniref:Uncharacterized protein n=1 Tax=Protopolystoma xenopodis TaxID=117903 RepID=A0A448X120_9PLAT|nr:unnamed protein product [Protopolystoma xenopodis]
MTTFDRLPLSERQYDVTLAYETLCTIVGLGFSIGYEAPPEGTRIRTLKLPARYIVLCDDQKVPVDFVLQLFGLLRSLCF